MNDTDTEEYNNIIQELEAAEEEGEIALSLFLNDLIEIDIESNFNFRYTIIERVLNICVKSLNNHLLLLSNECIYFIRYCINKCENIKEEVDENFFKNLNNIISVCLNERKYPDDIFLLFERSFFLFVQDINSIENFMDVWNGHNEYLNFFTVSLLKIIAFHLCLLNETIFHLKNSTSTKRNKKERAGETIDDTTGDGISNTTSNITGENVSRVTETNGVIETNEITETNEVSETNGISEVDETSGFEETSGFGETNGVHGISTTSEENNIALNKSGCIGTIQGTSMEGNTSVGESSLKTEAATKSEFFETNVSFIQKGYSRIKIIEIASDLLLYFFENSAEIKCIEDFEDCVNIILKEYEIIPDIEIKKKILLLFKSISTYAFENGLSTPPYIISINNLIKRKRNYYLTLTKEKDIHINYLKENSYIYINNNVLGIRTVSYVNTENSSENANQTETTILTPVGFKGSLLINIFYVYFYNTKNELLMVLSYDQIHFKPDEENAKMITLQFARDDAHGVLSNTLKQKFEEYFQDIIEISVTFNSAETKTKIHDILTNIVRIENAKVNIEDIGEEEESEENEDRTSATFGTGIDTEGNEEKENFSNEEEKEEEEEEEEMIEKEMIEKEMIEKEMIEKETKIDKNKDKVRRETCDPHIEILKEKLQRRKVSFATTKEIRLLNDNESVASRTIPLEESINQFSYSGNEYSYYENESSINVASASVLEQDQEDLQNNEIVSVTSSVLNNKLMRNEYSHHKILNGVEYTYQKYEGMYDREKKKDRDQYDTTEEREEQTPVQFKETEDGSDYVLDMNISMMDKRTKLAFSSYERKCFSEKDGDDYKKLNEQNEALKATGGKTVFDRYKYKETHPNKFLKNDTKKRNTNLEPIATDENNLELNIIEKKSNENNTKNDESVGEKNEAPDTKEKDAIISKEEFSKHGEISSISTKDIVDELLDLNYKQKNINECIRNLKKTHTTNRTDPDSQNTENVKENKTEINMTSTENDGRRRSKRVQAQKAGYPFEILQMIENHQKLEKEKKEKGNKEKMEKKNTEVNDEFKTTETKNVSELISIVGIDEPSNLPTSKNNMGNGKIIEENIKENIEENNLYRSFERNENEMYDEKKEETNITGVSSNDRRSIISSINKKRASTQATPDIEECYSKSNIDSPYPLKKIKQSNYDSAFLDSLKRDDNLENLSVKYLIKAYTLIQYNRRYVHIQIVDYFRQIKNEILKTHQDINRKYDNMLIDLKNEYEKKFESIITKYSTRLISKKKKLNTNAPQVLDLKMIQHKLKILEETLEIIKNTVKHKIQNSIILLKYKESDLYTPTFSLATILSKHSL